MNRISTKLILLLIISALVPITVFGVVAIWSARETAREIVTEKNLQVAKLTIATGHIYRISGVPKPCQFIQRKGSVVTDPFLWGLLIINV